MEEAISQPNNTTRMAPIPTATLVLAIIVAAFNICVVFLTAFLLLRKIIRLRKPLILYVKYIVLCNFFVAGGHLVGAVRYLVVHSGEHIHEGPADNLCIFQSIFTTFANLATFFWMMMIEWSAYRLMAGKHAPLRRGSWFLHILCWLIPAAIVSLAIVNGALGEDHRLSGPGYCWIKGNYMSRWQASLFWGLLTAKGWEVLAIFANVHFYFYSFCIFHRRMYLSELDTFMIEDDSESNADEHVFRNSVEVRTERIRAQQEQRDLNWECRGVALLPLNLMILRIWGTVRFWIDISILYMAPQSIHLESASKVLLNFQSVGDSSLAFFNFMLLSAVKWSQLTAAFPWLKRFRPCKWLSQNQETFEFTNTKKIVKPVGVAEEEQLKTAEENIRESFG